MIGSAQQQMRVLMRKALRHLHLNRGCEIHAFERTTFSPKQVLFYTHWMARLTSGTAVALVYLFFAVSAALQRWASVTDTLQRQDSGPSAVLIVAAD